MVGWATYAHPEKPTLGGSLALRARIPLGQAPAHPTEAMKIMQPLQLFRFSGGQSSQAAHAAELGVRRLEGRLMKRVPSSELTPDSDCNDGVYDHEGKPFTGVSFTLHGNGKLCSETENRD